MNIVEHKGQQLAPQGPGFTTDQVEMIKRQFAKGATDDELKLFLYTAGRLGLDPLAKQIYFQKRRSKNGGTDIAIITGIDGYRLVADRTDKYAGNDDPVFDDEDSPRKATVTVYKIIGGIRCPFTASARWDQYYPGDAQGFMWRKMPHHMLGKCAEALALRKAFPAELAGVYIKEEMEQAGPTTDEQHIDAVVVEEPRRVEQKPSNPVKTASLYTGQEDQQRIIMGLLKKDNVPPEYWDEISDHLMGRPSSDWKKAVAEVRNKYAR